MVTADAPGYSDTYASFDWNIPRQFNIGADVCDKWARRDPDRPAIVEYVDGRVLSTSFGELMVRSNQLANLLLSLGFRREDRIAVLAPQRVETAIAHIAAYKAGAIVVPLFTLFGLEALHHRLKDSRARFVVADAAGARKLDEIRGNLPDLEVVLCLDDDVGLPQLERLTAGQSETFDVVDTAADDPALIIYTSGTTGLSKGALHAHRVLLGHLPGVEMSHGGFPCEGDRIWTPADWAWIGGLLDVLLPALHHGVSVVAYRSTKFNVTATFELISACGIRNMFLPPTALKMMRTLAAPPAEWPFTLRSVASGGESLGGELLRWGRDVLGVTINEFYGQTECNMVLSSCDNWFPPKPGYIGKPVPGHHVAIVDDTGDELPAGQEGNIAVASPDPVMFLGYWELSEASADKFRDQWLLTGDRGIADEQGFIRFVGRADDVINSAGYRIGPGEIEDCLLRHPAVLSVGVIGLPDATRTEVVAAFVVVKPGHGADERLSTALQDHVRTKLGGHQYPRHIFFVDELPLTATGKIMRRDLRAWAKEATE